MKNYVFRYGLVGGTLSIALGILNWFTISQWYGTTISQVVGWLSITLSLMCVPLGIKYFRDKLNNGQVSFSKSFRIGLGITSVVSVLIFIYSILFSLLAGEDFEKWREQGLSEAELIELRAQMEQVPEFVNSIWFQGIALALSVFIIGSIINLGSSLILKQAVKNHAN